MTSHITTPCLPQSKIETTGQLFDNWFDPIEANLRDRAREFLQAMLEAELEVALGRSRYARRRMRASGDSEETANVTGHRHGHRLCFTARRPCADGAEALPRLQLDPRQQGADRCHLESQS